jgi:hypothetical protein
MQLSINQLSELTEKDRRTITTRLKDLAYVDGEKGAHLYNAPEALELIYGAKGGKANLEQKRCEEIDLNMEIKRKHRIPIAVPLTANDQAVQSLTATLKAAKGKTLTAELINDLIGKIRDIPAQLDVSKW